MKEVAPRKHALRDGADGVAGEVQARVGALNQAYLRALKREVSGQLPGRPVAGPQDPLADADRDGTVGLASLLLEEHDRRRNVDTWQRELRRCEREIHLGVPPARHRGAERG